MPRRYTVFTALAFVSLAASAQNGIGAIEVNSEVIDVSGIGHQRSFPCEGRKLIVAGSNHVINTTGACSSVEVSGDSNVVQVTLAAKGRFEVVGHANKLTWSAPDTPAQSVSGIGHQIKRVK